MAQDAAGCSERRWEGSERVWSPLELRRPPVTTPFGRRYLLAPCRRAHKHTYLPQTTDWLQPSALCKLSIHPPEAATFEPQKRALQTNGEARTKCKPKRSTGASQPASQLGPRLEQALAGPHHVIMSKHFYYERGSQFTVADHCYHFELGPSAGQSPTFVPGARGRGRARAPEREADAR